MAKKNNTLNRTEIVYFKSIDTSNGNGNADAGNMPRTLPDGRGLLSPGSEKHKYREFMHEVLGENVVYRTGNVRKDHYVAMDKKKGDLRTNLCRDAIDIRMFGTVVTGVDGAESIHGPVQFAWMKSLDAVTPIQESITCCSPAKMEKGKKTGVMGSSWIIPYALYRGEIFVSPTHACRTRDKGSTSTAAFRGTGMQQADLDKLYEALFYAGEHTRSATRTGAVTERVFVFEHSSVRGNGRAHELFRRIQVQLRDGVMTPSSFEDYNFEIDAADLPKGVKLWEYCLDDNGDVQRKQLKGKTVSAKSKPAPKNGRTQAADEFPSFAE